MLKVLLVLAGSFSLVVGAAEGVDSATASARQIFQKRQQVVVGIRVILKMQMGGGEMGPGRDFERKSETVGTIVDSSGLTVTSYSTLDPMSLFGDAFSEGESSMPVPKTQFSEVKIILDGGTEIAAKVILKDPELDLALIAPEAPPQGKAPQTFPCVDLQEGASVDVLDALALIGRLGKKMDRRPQIRLVRVCAVVSKPKLLYLVDTLPVGLGAPAFSLDGKFVGIGILPRHLFQQDGEGMAPTADIVSLAILPANELLLITKEALKPAVPPPVPPEKSPGGQVLTAPGETKGPAA